MQSTHTTLGINLLFLGKSECDFNILQENETRVLV